MKRIRAVRGATIHFDPRGIGGVRFNELLQLLRVPNPDKAQAERLGLFKARFIKPYLNAWTLTQGGTRCDLPYGADSDPQVRAILSDLVDIEDDPDNLGRPLEGLGGAERVSLYNYQAQALARLLEARRGIVVAPCGSGKTRIGVALARALGRSCLWLTHTEKLLKQSEGVWRSFFGDAGVGEITEGRVNVGRNITFATVQTLSRIDRSWTEFGTVIVDEAHHCAGTPTKLRMFSKALERINARYKFGLTATPKRQDGLFKTAKWLLGGIAYTISPTELPGRLKPTYIRIDTGITHPSHLWTHPDGTIDFNAYQALIANDGLRNEAIARKVSDLSHTSRGQLILCSRIVQAKDIYARIQRRIGEAESVALLIGETGRRTSLRGKEVIVATYAIAKEGLDVPELDTLHYASPVKDEVAIVQSVGRISRTCEGKTSATVFDYVDADPYAESAATKRRRIIHREVTR